MESLRGKVVLVDFWTYSCINCIRTLPYVTGWYEKYKNDGLVIVGVHTPEFEFEKVTSNVETAIQRHNITYPVAQDNSFATWSAYKNRYWPAKYLVDKLGNVVYTHFGEGEYDTTENAIRYLLGLDGAANTQNPKHGNVRTPEIYFGTDRIDNLTKTQSPSKEPTNYALPKELKLNEFALEGEWQFDGEKATLTKAPGKIKLKFYAGKVHMVAQSLKKALMEVKVDGVVVQTMEIGPSQLYTLFDSDQYTEHELELYIDNDSFEAFTFTFG
jgi:thiol-disulfide isomerase/thioredoxin